MLISFSGVPALQCAAILGEENCITYSLILRTCVRINCLVTFRWSCSAYAMCLSRISWAVKVVARVSHASSKAGRDSTGLKTLTNLSVHRHVLSTVYRENWSRCDTVRAAAVEKGMQEFMVKGRAAVTTAGVNPFPCRLGYEQLSGGQTNFVCLFFLV